MKTTKKGFTLIELIVVIAIIGVLAAILVPAMLGYVKKSKIQSANTAASTILKACNSALAELDEIDATYESGIIMSNITGITLDAEPGKPTEDPDIVKDYMMSYFDGAKSAQYAVKVQNSVAIYCACKSGSYFGSSPSYWTAKSYPSTGASLQGTFTKAGEVWKSKHAASGT